MAGIRCEERLKIIKGTKSARVIQVIKTTAIKGLGTEEDPAREVIQYWDFDGNLLAETGCTTNKPTLTQGEHRKEKNEKCKLLMIFG